MCFSMVHVHELRQGPKGAISHSDNRLPNDVDNKMVLAMQA